MASKVLGDLFQGSGNLYGGGGAAAIETQTGVSGLVWDGGFMTRSGAGGMLAAQNDFDQHTIIASLAGSGFSLSTGVAVFEVSVHCAAQFTVNFPSGYYVRMLAYDTTGSWNFEHPSNSSSGSFSVSPARTSSTTSVYRIEVEAAVTRMYFNGTLAATLAFGWVSGTAPANVETMFIVNSFYGILPFTSVQVLNYAHFKTETTSGALGVPTSGGGGETPVPATLLDDYFDISPTIHGSRPQFSAWTGAWNCKQLNLADGLIVLPARRTAGGAVIAPTYNAITCSMEFIATNPFRIGGGSAVAQVLVYGSPQVTLNIGAGGLVFNATSLTSADVGVMGSATPYSVTTGPSGRTDLVFVLSETGAKIYVNSTLVRTIAGGSPDTQISGITISWPGPQNSEPTRLPVGESRMVDLVRIRHGMTTDFLVYPGPRAAPVPQQYVSARPTKTIGEFTQQGQRKLIVPSGTKIALDAVNFANPADVELEVTAAATGSGSSALRRTLPAEMTTPSSMNDDVMKLQTTYTYTDTSTPYLTGPYGGNEVGHYESELVWPATEYHGDWYVWNWVVDYVMPTYYQELWTTSGTTDVGTSASAISHRTDLSIADLTIPADDAKLSVELRTASNSGVTPGFTVPGRGFYSTIVVADVLTPADVLRYNITVHPPYISPVDPSLLPEEQRRVAKLIAETVDDYRSFWTRFNATYEEPNETP